MTTDLDRLREALPPLPGLNEDELSGLTDNPNTQDVVDFVYAYARDYALTAVQAALAHKQAAPADGVLNRIIEWHRQQACWHEHAAKNEVRNKIEPVRSLLLSAAAMHEEFARALESRLLAAGGAQEGAEPVGWFCEWVSEGDEPEWRPRFECEFLTKKPIPEDGYDKVTPLYATPSTPAEAAGQGEPWFLRDNELDGDDPRSDAASEVWHNAMDAFNGVTQMRGFSEWCDKFRAGYRVLAAASPLATPTPGADLPGCGQCDRGGWCGRRDCKNIVPGTKSVPESPGSFAFDSIRAGVADVAAAIRETYRGSRLPAPEYLDQIVFGLERQARDLRRQADALGRRRDYAAEFPAADADRLDEAIATVKAIRQALE